jgi:hypothetical protein
VVGVGEPRPAFGQSAKAAGKLRPELREVVLSKSVDRDQDHKGWPVGFCLCAEACRDCASADEKECRDLQEWSLHQGNLEWWRTDGNIWRETRHPAIINRS